MLHLHCAAGESGLMLLTNTFLWLSFASCSPSMYQQRCASVILLCASLGTSKLPTLRSDATDDGDCRPEGSGGSWPGGGEGGEGAAWWWWWW